MWRERPSSNACVLAIGLALAMGVCASLPAPVQSQVRASDDTGPCKPPNSTAPAEALQLAVMLKTFVDSGLFQHGAGIVVGGEGGTLRVATAAHVVMDGGQPVDSIQAYFYTKCRQAVAARICSLPDPGRDLDLAVLCVPAPTGVRPTSSTRLGEVRRLSARTPVYPVGCPAGECWGVGQPDKVLVAGPDQPRILFTTFFVSPGHSGGPLFNQWWEVVGMLTKHGQPLSEALPVDSVMAAACDTGCGGKGEQLRSPFVPRGGYGLSLGLQGLFSSADAEPGGRFPPGRVNLMYRIHPLVELHAGSIRMTPEDLSVTGAMAGIGVNLPPTGRIWLNPFIEGGFAHVEGRFDAGGHLIDDGGSNRYVPLWRQVEDDGLGFGTGASLMVLVAPHTIVEVTGGHWSFNRPDGAPEMPDIVWGAGVRLGI